MDTENFENSLKTYIDILEEYDIRTAPTIRCIFEAGWLACQENSIMNLQELFDSMSENFASKEDGENLLNFIIDRVYDEKPL